MSRQNLIIFLLFTFLVSCSNETLENAFEDEAIGLEPSVDTSGLVEPGDAAPGSSPSAGIQDHNLYFAVSEDGETWDISTDEAILEMASVPNLLLLEKDVGDFQAGTLISHFVDASEMHDWGDERIGYITSEDSGETWSDRELISIEDKPEEISAVDPCVVQLEDGRLRLYFFDFSANKNLLEGQARDPTFYSAISSDGVTFDFEGEVYSSDAALITDPEVLWLEDRWVLFNPVFENAESMQASGGEIQISESEDGTNFEYLTTIDFQGIPGVLLEGDDTVVLFGCGSEGITRLSSIDGLNFDTSEVETLKPKLLGCDPDPAQLEDGTYVMMIKTFEMKK